MQSDRIDAAIDEVAAAMTAGEPGHTFTSEVMSRLPERAAPARSWRAALVLAPAAALALVLVAIVIARVIERRESVAAGVARGIESSAVAGRDAGRGLQPTTVPGRNGENRPPATGGAGRDAGDALQVVPPRSTGTTGQSARASSSAPLTGATARTAPDASTARNDSSRPAPALDLIATPRLDVTPLTTERINADLLRIDPLEAIPTMDVAPLGTDDERRREE